MFLESIKLCNFQSFGNIPTPIRLDAKMSALVGGNGSGKTAIMSALRRFFSVSNQDRAIRRSDFYFPQTGDSKQANELYIEVILAFPELEKEVSTGFSPVATFFNNMTFQDQDGKLKVRLRLEASWEDDGTIEGYISTKCFSINTFEDNINEDNKIPLAPLDRSRIQVVYIPANRSASKQVIQFLKGRLWQAINWSTSTKDLLEEKISEINQQVETESAIEHIVEKITYYWKQLYQAGTYSTPVINPLDSNFEDFIKNIEISLTPDEIGRNRDLSELSDGQNSLFHLALVATTIDLEISCFKSESNQFSQDLIHYLPYLTILAIEEPENNLSPYYLSKIIQQINDLVNLGMTQAIISSHSASVLSRIEPEQVRYFRLDEKFNSQVRELTLPTDTDEANKYVKEAIKAFPELYFAKFVVLGEGDSEEIVIPKIAEAMGIHLDRSFVAMVPLGGRHVNHFWRLLNDLNIPHATLLDLDWGRKGGGWGRITNSIKLLRKFHNMNSEFFPHAPSEWFHLIVKHEVFPEDVIEEISKKTNADFTEWLNTFENYSVFYTNPLDLDYSMFKAFPEYYKQAIPESGRGPNEVTTAEEKNDLWKAVLKTDGEYNLYDKDDEAILEKFRWYRYLFLGKGKPSTHIKALSLISTTELAEKAPQELKNLITAIQRHLNPIAGESDENN